jgi:hypothetical protein
MFTRKNKTHSGSPFDSSLLTGAPGKALVMAALLSGMAMPTAQAGDCRGQSLPTGCQQPPAAPVSPTGGKAGGVVGSYR